ncbi:unnamed protein product, partial [Chrysoparadoxa australica]
GKLSSSVTAKSWANEGELLARAAARWEADCAAALASRAAGKGCVEVLKLSLGSELEALVRGRRGTIVELEAARDGSSVKVTLAPHSN